MKNFGRKATQNFIKKSKWLPGCLFCRFFFHYQTDPKNRSYFVAASFCGKIDYRCSDSPNGHRKRFAFLSRMFSGRLFVGFCGGKQQGAPGSHRCRAWAVPAPPRWKQQMDLRGLRIRRRAFGILLGGMQCTAFIFIHLLHSPAECVFVCLCTLVHVYNFLFLCQKAPIHDRQAPRDAGVAQKNKDKQTHHSGAHPAGEKARNNYQP